MTSVPISMNHLRHAMKTVHMTTQGNVRTSNTAYLLFLSVEQSIGFTT